MSQGNLADQQDRPRPEGGSREGNMPQLKTKTMTENVKSGISTETAEKLTKKEITEVVEQTIKELSTNKISEVVDLVERTKEENGY